MWLQGLCPSALQIHCSNCCLGRHRASLLFLEGHQSRWAKGPLCPCNLSLTTYICKGPISMWGHMHRHQESGQYTLLGTQLSLHQWPAKPIKPVFFRKPSSNSSNVLTWLHPCFLHCLRIKSLKRQREWLTLKVKITSSGGAGSLQN